jgi:hypothetical protein
MATSNVAERLLRYLPMPVAWALLVVGAFPAFYGWAFSLLSLLSPVLDLAMRALPSAGGEDSAAIVALSAVLLLFLLAFIGLVGVTIIVDLGADEEQRPLRFKRSIVGFWTTFLAQVVVIPLALGDSSAVEICTPRHESFGGLALRFFLFGLIEGNVYVLGLMASRAMSIDRKRQIASDWTGLVHRRLLVGACILEALTLAVVPALVKHWAPLMQTLSSERGSEVAGLCRYPWALVATTYLNIAWSVRPLVIHMVSRIRVDRGAPDA